MIRKRFGRMIFIGSVAGLAGPAGQANYAASKAGVIGMARSVTRELGSRSITANVVAPGFIDTDMTRALDEKQQEMALKLSRCSESATPRRSPGWSASWHPRTPRYISGAVIPVDGGMGMGH